MTNQKYGCDYSISFHRVGNDDEKLLGNFKCKNEAIQDFIQYESIDSTKDVSYIFVDDENNRVIGFCAICCTGISISDEKEDGTSYTTSLPSIEIDYFAVDEDYRGIKLDKDADKHETLSQALFLSVLDMIKTISRNVVGATHICLYSVPEAYNFYKRCGFMNFKEYMNADELPYLDDCIPLFLRY